MLSKDDFIIWLVENKNKMVGRAGKCHECPVARFLTEKLGVWVGVGGDLYYLVGGVRYTIENTWFLDVAESIDRQFIDKQVRGKEVLKILETT